MRALRPADPVPLDASDRTLALRELHEPRAPADGGRLMPGWMEQAVERTFDDLRNCRISQQDALDLLWSITHGINPYQGVHELEALSV